MDDAKLAQAQQAYAAGQYAAAADLFAALAEELEAAGDVLSAAEMRNNQSVALLQAEQAQAALIAAQPTIEIFTRQEDWRRAGMAWGNTAAALEALGRLDEAIQAYQRSADLLGQAGEEEFRATVLQALAAAQLKQGDMMQSAFSTLEHLGVEASQPWWKRWLGKLLRRILVR